MNVLFFGDVVGQAGCERLRRELPRLKQVCQAGVVVANGENSAEGNGILPHSARHLFDSGVDIITTGNHSLRRREIYDLLEEQTGVLRPANYHPSAPGSGVFLYDHPAFSLCVINLQGRVYMEPVHQSPFDAVDLLLKPIDCPNILVDFHARRGAFYGGGFSCGSDRRKAGNGILSGWPRFSGSWHPYACSDRR